MRKIYVLDTSTIISDPQCLSSYPDADIIIHTKVLYELDKIKTFPSEAGKSARTFIRMLDDLSNTGDVTEGITTGENTLVKIDSYDYSTAEFGDPTYVDNKILACAKSLVNGAGNPVTVISQDINLRLRAKAAKMSAAHHFKTKTTTDEVYSGIKTICNTKLGEKLKTSKQLNCADSKLLKDLYPNECVIFTNKEGKTISLGRKLKNRIKFINGTKAWGLQAKNLEQAFALDMLMDPDVPLISLAGIAGTGKTILAVAAGLDAVINAKEYSKLVIYRPIQPVGTDMGYLPGDLCEKLEPWMAAIKDSMERLNMPKPNNGKRNGKRNGKYNKYNNNNDNHDNNGWANFNQYNDLIHMEALTYIRGRSIANAFILIDETQNITKDEIKTILTRAGEGTKIVLTGDIEQIDNYRLDALNNGLTNTIERFKSSELAGHITLTQGERSELATEAAKIL